MLKLLGFTHDGSEYYMVTNPAIRPERAWIYAAIFDASATVIKDICKHLNWMASQTAVSFVKIVDGAEVPAELPAGWSYVLEAL